MTDMLVYIHKKWALFSVLCACFAFAILSFNRGNNVVLLKQELEVSLDDFKEATAHLHASAQAYSLGKISIEELQLSIVETRKVFKEIEFILCYYYPEYVEEHLNGAPLLHLSRENTRSSVHVPQGMQYLDELIFSDEAYDERTNIAALSQDLKTAYASVYKDFLKVSFTEKDVIDAMRLQLIRIYTLGVSGFDTPGSLNAVEEALVSFEYLHKYADIFLQNITVEQRVKIDGYFKKGVDILKATPNFDELDRLSLLKGSIDPLYKILLQIRKQMGYEGVAPNVKTAWNVESESIFATDFLDPYFYTSLTKEEDSKALKALGKKLFYDTKLSENAKLSCGSCHRPEMGFADGQAKSESAVVGKTVQRNAPTLLNAVYSDRYFYDLRAFTLEQQAEHVVYNTLEFNTAYEAIVEKLNTDKNYKKLFKEALKVKKIEREHFSKALSSYVLSLQSFNSPFDKYVRDEVETIDPKVKDGFNLFMGKAACGTCHFAPLFIGLVPPLFIKNESEILGVLQSPNTEILDDDEGRIVNGISTEENWIYSKSFKTSSVRNVAVTAPYFHNGAYKTLEDVVDFYNHGGGVGLGVEVINQTLASDSLHLSENEKKNLVLFMESLTDNPYDKNY